MFLPAWIFWSLLYNLLACTDCFCLVFAVYCRRVTEFGPCLSLFFFRCCWSSFSSLFRFILSCLSFVFFFFSRAFLGRSVPPVLFFRSGWHVLGSLSRWEMVFALLHGSSWISFLIGCSVHPPQGDILTTYLGRTTDVLLHWALVVFE